MKTRFVQVSWGIQFTEAFLHISNIKDIIQSFQKQQELSSNSLIIQSSAATAQDRMEEEILQHIRISNQLAKDELYDYLTGWIQYFEQRIASSKNIEDEVNIYNEKRLKEYEKLIEENEIEFRNTERYKTLKHLDYYEAPNFFGSLRKINYSNKSRLEQFKRFLEAPDPDLIDTDYIPQYFEHIKPIMSRFVLLAFKWLSHLKPEANLLPPPKTTKPLPAPIPVSPDRLKIGVNVEQFAVLLRLLHECDIITSNKGEIHAFVADRIQTVGRTKERISQANFGKLFSSKNADIATFWIRQLQKMIEKAGKRK